MDPDRRKSVSLLIIPGMIALIVILFFLNERTVFEPPFLLAILNTVFLGLIPLFIASIAYQSYRTNGSENVLLLGAGMLIFGLGSIAAGSTLFLLERISPRHFTIARCASDRSSLLPR